MIGTSVPEYIFIRISIFFLQYTTPLCLVYLLILTALRGPGGALSWAGIPAIGYSIIDALYALLIYYPYNRRLKHAAEHPPLLARPERWALFIRCLDNIPDVTHYLQGWFLGADESDIRKDNVREFLSWAFLDRHPGNETAAELDELDEYLSEVEKRIGHELEPGRGKAKCLRLTLDEIEVRYRSVLWYLIIGIVDLITHFRLSHQGLLYYAQSKSQSQSVIPLRPQSMFATRRSVSQLSYWYRPHTAKDRLPLVFLHGIGVGLWPYTQYLANLNEATTEDDQVGLIALEYLPLSARLTSAPLSQEEFISQITNILADHGWDQFAVLGHSYGTVLAAHMLKSPDLGSRIQSVVLVDPVCILLHLPDVAYNFTRRKPRKANEYLLWYFASMDPGVAHCLGRHFFWKDNIAWKEDLLQIREKPSTDGRTNITEVHEDIGSDSGSDTEVDGVTMDLVDGMSAPSKKARVRKVAVCLSERDLIVDTRTVLQYLINDGDRMSTNGVPDSNGSIDTRYPIAMPGGDHFEQNGIEVEWFDGLDHAQIFDGKDSSARLAAVTRRAMDGGAD